MERSTDTADKDEAILVLVKEEVNDKTPETEIKTNKTEEHIQRVCDECKTYKTYCPETLLRHIRKVHRGENPYQCSDCDYSTRNNTRFQEHVNNHKGLKPFKCSLCDYSSVSKKYMKKHEANHAKCGCGFIAKNSRQLNKHKFENCNQKHQEHSTINQNVLEDSTKEVIKHTLNNCKNKNIDSSKETCIICKKLVTNIKSHLKKHFNLNSMNEKFVCVHCNWSSFVKRKILLHLIHHPNQDVEDIEGLEILRKYNIMK